MATLYSCWAKYKLNQIMESKFNLERRKSKSEIAMNRLAVNSGDLEIFRIAEQKLNVVILPSSIQLIKKLVNKGISNGLIKTEDEKDKVIATITIASIRYVKNHGGGRVRTKDIMDSWEEKISMGPGNCPPHRCMRRSILTRYDEISSSYPLVSKILSEIKG